MRHIMVLVEDKTLADAALAFARQLARAEGAAVHTPAVADAHGSLIRHIAKREPDLVVLATRRRPSVDGWLIHDMAGRIIGARLAPVVLIDTSGRTTAGLQGHQILVPLDGSEMAEAALPVALELARELKLGLTLLQAVPDHVVVPYAVPTQFQHDDGHDVELAWTAGPAAQAAHDYLDLVVRRLGNAADELQLAKQVRVGELTQEIRAIVAEERTSPIAMIVMAARGRIGVGRWLIGSSLADVVHNVDIPVVAAPPCNKCL
jgi:nucleotide-binding universal stress UspA family protein